MGDFPSGAKDWENTGEDFKITSQAGPVRTENGE